MMLRNGRYTMYQLLIAFLICMALTGQSQPNNVSSLSHPSQASTTDLESSTEWKKTTLINGTGQIGNKTSSKYMGVLSETQIRIINIITMSVAATGAVLNTVVILAIIIDPLKTLRKGAWITILNLAIADLISCISAICLWGYNYFKVIYESEINIAICNFGWSFGVSASFLLLTFFTVQIYVITKFPLRSRFMFTEFRLVLITLAVWIFSFPLGLSYIVYLHFFWKTCLKIYAARIGVLQMALLVQVILNIQVTIEIMRSGRSAGNDSSQNNKHRNIAKTVIILTLILFFTAFPFFLLRQIEFIARLGHFQGKATQILVAITYCYAPIALLNFTANPILYSLRLPDYRRTMLAFVGKIKSKGGASLLKSTPNTSLKLTILQGSSDASSSQRSKRCSMERSSVPATSPL